MPPSSLPSGRKQPSCFCSVDWLSQSSCSGPGQGFGIRDTPQTISTQEAKLSEPTVREKPEAGLSKASGPTRAPRIRTAFTSEQVSALEGAFQHCQYLGPLERRKLAQRVQLSEMQIKTWFQNRRMKHKRQMQDSQLNVPSSWPLRTSLALSPSPAPGRGLQLPYTRALLPGLQALMLPLGSFCVSSPAGGAARTSTPSSGHNRKLRTGRFLRVWTCAMLLLGLKAEQLRLGPPCPADEKLGARQEPFSILFTKTVGPGRLSVLHGPNLGWVDGSLQPLGVPSQSQGSLVGLCLDGTLRISTKRQRHCH